MLIDKLLGVFMTLIGVVIIFIASLFLIPINEFYLQEFYLSLVLTILMIVGIFGGVIVIFMGLDILRTELS